MEYLLSELGSYTEGGDFRMSIGNVIAEGSHTYKRSIPSFDKTSNDRTN